MTPAGKAAPQPLPLSTLLSSVSAFAHCLRCCSTCWSSRLFYTAFCNYHYFTRPIFPFTDVSGAPDPAMLSSCILVALARRPHSAPRQHLILTMSRLSSLILTLRIYPFSRLCATPLFWSTTQIRVCWCTVFGLPETQKGGAAYFSPIQDPFASHLAFLTLSPPLDLLTKWPLHHPYPAFSFKFPPSCVNLVAPDRIHCSA
ncbi:unnamed protein product [Periconia digitata]|uniref:Secreted protein n=1 Tax=Periconia digitata TaxID=1303443 RepID=A0A9W4U6T1_9PLEO|nr:unnamed protein product [Periconia digitata]